MPERRAGRASLSRRASALLAAAALVLGALAALTLVPLTTASAATDPCGRGGNPIACENAKPGTPRSVWDVSGSGSATIQGFSTDISVDLGQRIDFKISTDAPAYDITIYRLGYYGGDGARQVATVTPSATLPQVQPSCITDSTTELTDCGNWAVSASWTVPSTAVSGVYIARLHRADTGAASHITFVVRDDASHSDVVFQTSDPTWQAYNTYGGSDFYQGAAHGRAYKISYNRPVLTRDGTGGRDFFFANEYPLVRFLERNGYDLSYIAGVDTDRAGGLLTNHRTFLSVGHDEYWSKGQRANVEAARDAGVNLQFLSGNEVYWKTRYEASADAGHTAYRTLVCYKETWSNAKIDPSSEWTGTWRDPRFAPRSAGAGVPENGLTGTIFESNYTDLPLQVSAAEGRLRLWRGTSLSSLAAGTSATLAPHTVGYESDEDLDNGARPPGLVRFSTTSGSVPQYLYDFGNDVRAGTTTHHLTMYRAASGALVFGAGTVQWTWGLDEVHDSPFAPEPADPRMQQAQVNLLADMGAQPATLMAGLVAASSSTDTTGPTVSITSPAAGATEPNGTRVTVTGSATDSGGQVAGVEASTDGGTSWHPATGTASWSFTYTQHGRGSVPVQVRAVDDSANIGAAVTRSFAVACPCTVFGAEVPATPAANDSQAVELGLRFTPTVDGTVTGVRFYKGAGNTGTHVGSLWSSSGALLATATYTGESATGWQSVAFSTPVSVSAGQTYTASYTAPAGHYAAQAWAFSSAGLDADPLRLAGGYGAAKAGVYANPGQLPTQTYQDANYYVDPVFSALDTSALTVGSQWPASGASSVPVDTTVSGTFSHDAVASTVGLVLTDPQGATVAGSTTYDATRRTVTFRPSSALAVGTTYTATVSGSDSSGTQVSTGRTWSFTTATSATTSGVCPCSLFDTSTVPGLLEAADTVPVTLGVRFTADVDGTVTAIRFYKGTNNTGTHTGTLWSASGQQLATGTFTNESASGWQTMTFSQPVAISANTQYVAAYRTEVGRYSATLNAFAASDLSRPPLHVTSTAGAYTYGTGFPSSTSSTSYLVDLVFQRAASSTFSITSQSPAPGAVDVARTSPVVVDFSGAVAPGWSISATQQPSGTAIAGSAALDSTGTRLTFTPSALLPADSDVRVQLSGVTSTSGASLAAQSWTFHTRAADTTGGQSLFTTQLPQNTSAADSAAVELGTAFVPARSGTVTAIRFFKGTGNDGTHTGSLWSSSGTRLATVTFTGETASGWQQATLSSAVPVTAGTTYVVSYFAPQGHYSYTSGFFGTALTNGDLTAPATSNGRYLYAANGGFPTSSYGATSYFVDVVFVAGTSTTSTTTSLFTGVTPATAAVSDTGAVELGTVFSPSVDGTVTAIRFYKGSGNTGTHTGSIWSSSGTRLATVTFTNETATGWQSAALATPLALSAGQTYVVSYYAPNGQYAYTGGYFSSPRTVGPLTAPATQNGRFVYGTGGGFPTGSYNAASYFVDMVFQSP